MWVEIRKRFQYKKMRFDSFNKLFLILEQTVVVALEGLKRYPLTHFYRLLLICETSDRSIAGSN